MDKSDFFDVGDEVEVVRSDFCNKRDRKRLRPAWSKTVTNTT